jgi:hypothetical protein
MVHRDQVDVTVYITAFECTHECTPDNKLHCGGAVAVVLAVSLATTVANFHRHINRGVAYAR